MKLHKITLICMIPVSLLFLVLAVLLENGSYCKQFILVNEHRDFFVNIFIGLFCSTILVIIPSIVWYWHEKKQYYFDIYIIANKLMSNALALIEYIKNISVDQSQLCNKIDTFNIHYNEFISCYLKFSCFLYKNKQDRLIESILNEMFKLDKTLEIIADACMKVDDIEHKEEKLYRDQFIRSLEQYKSTLAVLSKMVSENIKKSLKGKIIKTNKA